MTVKLDKQNDRKKAAQEIFFFHVFQFKGERSCWDGFHNN